MIEVSIKFTVPPGKRKEILQTLLSILVQVRCKQGCINCNCYEDIESENSILFNEVWNTSQDLDSHLRSVHFGVLTGAMQLLEKEPDIRFNTISNTAGTEVIKAAHAR